MFKFNTKRQAINYMKCNYTDRFMARNSVVKSRYWSMDEWTWKPCWVLVLNK